MWGRPCLKLTEGHIFFGKITKGINHKTAALQQGMISRAMKRFTEVVGKYWLNRLVLLYFLCLFGSSVWISQSLNFFLERFLSCVLRSKSVIERLQFAGIFCKNCHHLIGLCLTGLGTYLIRGDKSVFETRRRASPAAFAGPSLLPHLLI